MFLRSLCLKLSVIVFVLIILTACSSGNNITTNTEGDDVKPSPSLGIPYSKGPSAPPEVKGPTAPPPSATSDSNTPQAVTENDNNEYTLPKE